MILESNILIYAADPDDKCCGDYVEAVEAVISVVSRIEILGFPGFSALPESQRARLHDLAHSLPEIPIEEAVVNRAILLRQSRKMSLADAIIASTALVQNQALVTRNVADFRHIDGLRIINPFDPGG